MENYYFIQKKGDKIGPIKLEELKKQVIYFDELIWRSDSEEWKKAAEFEELKGVVIINPPQTPLEKKRKNFNYHFSRSVIPNAIIFSIVVAFIISFVSYLIANKSWEDEKKGYVTNKEDVGRTGLSLQENYKLLDLQSAKAMKKEFENIKQYVKPILEKKGYKFDRCKKSIQDSIRKFHDLEEKINLKLYNVAASDMSLSESEFSDTAYIDSLINEIEYNSKNRTTTIQPEIKVPDNISQTEDSYSSSQTFILRPFYAIFSHIYLTIEEQNNSGVLFLDLTLSSLLFITLPLILYLILYYLIKEGDYKENKK